MMTLEQFETSCQTLKDYWGVVGIFGGNPALHPQFEAICEIMRKYIPKEQRGLWCNNPMGKGRAMRETFNPAVSNLNVHLNQKAFDEFKHDWPECAPFGLNEDSRHSPVYVSMDDLGIPKEDRYELISFCDINQNWSAMVCVFRGELRGYFCEIAGAQAMLRQNDTRVRDTGLQISEGWWQQKMESFKWQVRQHCHDCGVPLRGHGQLANAIDDKEQTSEVYQDIFKPKKPGREIEVVTNLVQLGKPLNSTTDYMGNANK